MRLALTLALVAAAAPVDRALDLAGPFASRSPWRLTIEQGPPVPDSVMAGGGQVDGAVAVCLSADGGRTCAPEPRDALRLPHEDDFYAVPHELRRATIVRPRRDRPLLLLQLASLHSVNGNQRVATQLYRYDRGGDRFRLVYQHLVGRNNNEEVRYIDTGPLRGAVIAAEPTADAPFAFWITVSRIGADAGEYRPILRYRSATRYGDGNPLAVIDSEMPQIERRLGIWRPGRPLPPAASACAQPHLLRGELWCGQQIG